MYWITVHLHFLGAAGCVSNLADQTPEKELFHKTYQVSTSFYEVNKIKTNRKFEHLKIPRPYIKKYIYKHFTCIITKKNVYFTFLFG